ncbi:ribosomal biogenesis factor-like [Huso huso]
MHIYDVISHGVVPSPVGPPETLVDMAKNRSKGQKQKNVFQVANKNSKPKNKTKPVATSLKRIKVGNSDKVDNMNKIFTEVQREVKSISKCTAQEPTQQLQVTKPAPVEILNMDATAQLFSQL